MSEPMILQHEKLDRPREELTDSDPHLQTGDSNGSARYLYLIVGVPLIAFFLAALPAIQGRGIAVPLQDIAAGSVGLLLQSIPFVLIGVLVSAAVENWMTEEFIERHFPHTVFGGFATALLAGICMPVCDCVVVPTFARLVKKQLPLPYAVTFLCAVPVINPVAIWSTWFAFWDMPWVVAARIGLGCLIALLVGASFLVIPASHPVVRSGGEGSADPHGGHMLMHNHVVDAVASGGRAGRSVTSQLRDYAVHIHGDFMTMTPIILFGVIVASTIRTLLGSDPASKLGVTSLLGAIAIMMVIAYASSLCSTSDAVIARSLVAAFPMPAILGFLLFGPMLDLKNTLMFVSQCRWRFTARIAVTITSVCLLVTVCFGLIAQW